MGYSVSDDILDGFCCFKCKDYFKEKHGYPVLCEKCWEAASLEERSKGKKASHARLVVPDAKVRTSEKGSGSSVNEDASDEADALRKIDVRGIVMDFGKHMGKRLEWVPPGYLEWAISVPISRLTETSSGTFPFWKVAQAELFRRSAPCRPIDLSYLAIDQLSLKYVKKWTEAGTDEGFCSWALRMAKEAWEHRKDPGVEAFRKSGSGIWMISYSDIVWIVEDSSPPVVRTVK